MKLENWTQFQADWNCIFLHFVSPKLNDDLANKLFLMIELYEYSSIAYRSLPKIKMVCKLNFAECGYHETENYKFSLHLTNFQGSKKHLEIQTLSHCLATLEAELGFGP
jgi:hypothetical protein